MKYKMMKVFDCQHMPQDIRNALFEHYQRPNDIAFSFDVGDEYESTPAEKVNQWLMANGADSGECIIIKYWW